jgi:hypothetical protein
LSRSRHSDQAADENRQQDDQQVEIRGVKRSITNAMPAHQSTAVIASAGTASRKERRR